MEITHTQQCTYFSSATFCLFRRHLIFIPPLLSLLKRCSRSSLRCLVGNSNTEPRSLILNNAQALSPRYLNELRRQHVSHATVTFASPWQTHAPAPCSTAICERQNFHRPQREWKKIKNKEPEIDFMRNSNVPTVCVFHGQDVQIVDFYKEQKKKNSCNC